MESITLDDNQLERIVSAAEFMEEESLKEDTTYVLHSRNYGNIEIVRSVDDYFLTL
ncbi:MAG: hypothetical protein J6Q61_01035 [Bacteroidales bacterium]|nr:hypothetical protein [Bacteroidales bacterium]